MQPDLPPASETAPAQDPVLLPPSAFRIRWWIRVLLFVIHSAALSAAVSLTPSSYAFELGHYFGLLLILSCICLWGFLFSMQARKGILWFCIVALVQTGCLALVGLRFQAEQQVLQTVMDEYLSRRSAWESEMGKFRMDPLIEMTLGKRELNTDDLRALQARARAAETRIDEIHSELWRSEVEAEGRIAHVSAIEAGNFHRGFESNRSAWEEQFKLAKENFVAMEQLTAFLIDHYGQYSQTANGLVFKRVEDYDECNKQLDKIANLQEQMISLARQQHQSPPSQ